MAHHARRRRRTRPRGLPTGVATVLETTIASWVGATGVGWLIFAHDAVVVDPRGSLVTWAIGTGVGVTLITVAPMLLTNAGGREQR